MSVRQLDATEKRTLALWLPLVIGSWSDRLRTPLGGRRPFMLAGTPLAILSLAFIGFSDW